MPGPDRLDEAALAAQGWCVVDILDPEALREAWRGFERLGMDPDTPMLTTNVDSPRAVARAVDQHIKSIVRPILADLAPEMEPFLAAYITKGYTGGFVDLHQDWTYHDERESRAILYWCPLVDAGPDQGTLHVVSGSHRWSDRLRGSGSVPGLGEDIQDLLWSRAEAVPLRAGQALAYDPAIIHGSTPSGGTLRPVMAFATVATGTQLYQTHRYDDGRVEVFAIDESWYTVQPFGQPPQGFSTVDAWAEITVPLTHEQALALLDAPSATIAHSGTRQ